MEFIIYAFCARSQVSSCWRCCWCLCSSVWLAPDVFAFTLAPLGLAIVILVNPGHPEGDPNLSFADVAAAASFFSNSCGNSVFLSQK